MGINCHCPVFAAGCRFVVRGVTTNMPHVRSCIANADFKRGQYDTSFIPKYYGGPGAAADMKHRTLEIWLACVLVAVSLCLYSHCDTRFCGAPGAK
jgi:acetyl/propionyl-CoA carboxylase alpha subunit